MRKGIQAIESGLANESHLQDGKFEEKLQAIRQIWTECPIKDLVVNSLQVALKHSYKTNTLACISDLLHASLMIMPLQARSQTISVAVAQICEYYVQRSQATANQIQGLLTELLGPLLSVPPRQQQRQLSQHTWFAADPAAAGMFNRGLSQFVAQFKSQVVSK